MSELRGKLDNFFVKFSPRLKNPGDKEVTFIVKTFKLFFYIEIAHLIEDL